LTYNRKFATIPLGFLRNKNMERATIHGLVDKLPDAKLAPATVALATEKAKSAAS
jgi:hypothetical protein